MDKIIKFKDNSWKFHARKLASMSLNTPMKSEFSSTHIAEKKTFQATAREIAGAFIPTTGAWPAEIMSVFGGPLIVSNHNFDSACIPSSNRNNIPGFFDNDPTVESSPVNLFLRKS